MTKEDVQYKQIKGETKNDLTRQRKMYIVQYKKRKGEGGVGGGGWLHS